MSELNTMQVGEHIAVVAFDPELGMFRGEFTGLNGGADFYGASIDELKAEGEASLRVFLDVCRKRGIAPVKKAAASYPLRLPEAVKAKADIAARARNISFNKLVELALGRELSELSAMMASAGRKSPIVVGEGRAVKVKKAVAKKKASIREKKVAGVRPGSPKGRVTEKPAPTHKVRAA